MRYVRRALYLLFAFPIVVLLTTFPFAFSHRHPQYADFSEIIYNAKPSQKINFAVVNDGDWTKLCFFGGYTNPLGTMRKFGDVTVFDRVYQFFKGLPLLRFGQVEESETMIAYVDGQNVVHFIHFRVTPFASVENQIICTDRNRPSISIFRA